MYTPPLSKPFPILRHLNVPTLLTVLGITCGVSAIHRATHHAFHDATLFMLGAIFFDQIDGMAARKLGRVTSFGGYLDVFGDFVSYCLFPASVLHASSESSRALLVAVLMLVLTGAMRLAHYLATSTKDVVIGLPCCVLLAGLPLVTKLTAPVVAALSIVYALAASTLYLSSLASQRSGPVGKFLMLLLAGVAVREAAVVWS